MNNRLTFLITLVVAVFMQSEAAFGNLNTAEYFINNDPGEGSGTVLEAKDGKFDSLYEEVSLSGIDISGLSVGDHRIGIRYKDKVGNWSVVQYQGFKVLNEDVQLEPEVVGGGSQAAGNQMVGLGTTVRVRTSNSLMYVRVNTL